ncbi:MAG: hypothetical protein KGZ96_02060 [Clostridia bacterium]|nr:hypothetical protein [Clostridia bacterium]
MLASFIGKIKEKLSIKLGAVILVMLAVVAAGYGGVKIYQETVKVVPEELLAETLDKTLAATSYSYSVNLEMTTNGEKRKLTNIVGIKANETDFYIQGEMYESQVEIYQFADSTYQKDPVSGKWMMFPTSVTDMELLMTEINPMVNFQFNQFNEITYEGIQKLNNHKKYVLKLKPRINNKFLEIYWENFEYTLWVDKGDKYISQAAITANNIKNPQNSLTLTITLDDYNKDFSLEKPE